ncbi:MAG: hypothetical protein ACQEW8_13745 [Actinomycetota bacterium]
MSTEDDASEVTPPPRTRAEARAAREAAEREAAEQTAGSPPASAPEEPAPAEPAAPDESAPSVPLPERPVDVGAVPAAGMPLEVDEAPERDPLVPPPAEDAGVAAPAPGRRRFSPFVRTMVAVVGVLAVVSGALAGASLLQGPRLSEVQVDPAQAIEVSGSRMILTANQPLTEIDPEQVTVEPEVPFTVDAAGRGIGVRFTVPLDDETEYTVRVTDVTGVGSGRVGDLETSFTTPAAEIYLLQRSAEGDDAIFRTDLTGEQAVPVFTHPRINDYRATATQLVVAVEEDDRSSILVMNRDGTDERELTLPGDGYIRGIQVSERGGLVGYSYSDRELSDTSGRASVLVTQSLNGDDEPRIVEVGGEEASIGEWQFVPDSAAVLFIDFEGALALEDVTTDAGVQSLGIASTIRGISRGTYTAIVERIDGSVVELNLADGSEEPLAASEPDYGTATTITPFPGGTLRHVVARDAEGFPTGQAVIRVDDDGAATPLLEVTGNDAIMQACPSPSGQYAAVVVAPDLVENIRDDMTLPLPQTLNTHLIDVESGDELVALAGFDISWCQTAPAA